MSCFKFLMVSNTEDVRITCGCSEFAVGSNFNEVRLKSKQDLMRKMKGKAVVCYSEKKNCHYIQTALNETDNL